MFLDLDAVAELIAQVSTDIIVPRFRTLRGADIQVKATAGDVEDIVTIVDHEAEAALTAGLRDLMDAPVLGEEATAHDASRLSLLQTDGALWVVDPLDGTKNFAAGDDGFGVMVSFVERRAVRAAWVLLGARQESFVAEAGSGTFLNGQRIRTPVEAVVERPRGSLFVRFMPAEHRESVVARLGTRIEAVPQCGAAAVEYTDVLRGRKDFVIYYRLLPWDHGAPALVLREAGGTVTHLDGRDYAISSPNQVTIGARDQAVSRRLRGWIEESGS